MLPRICFDFRSFIMPRKAGGSPCVRILASCVTADAWLQRVGSAIVVWCAPKTSWSLWTFEPRWNRVEIHVEIMFSNDVETIKSRPFFWFAPWDAFGPPTSWEMMNRQLRPSASCGSQGTSPQKDPKAFGLSDYMYIYIIIFLYMYINIYICIVIFVYIICYVYTLY